MSCALSRHLFSLVLSSATIRPAGSARAYKSNYPATYRRGTHTDGEPRAGRGRTTNGTERNGSDRIGSDEGLSHLCTSMSMFVAGFNSTYAAPSAQLHTFMVFRSTMTRLCDTPSLTNANSRCRCWLCIAADDSAILLAFTIVIPMIVVADTVVALRSAQRF